MCYELLFIVIISNKRENYNSVKAEWEFKYNIINLCLEAITDIYIIRTATLF